MDQAGHIVLIGMPGSGKSKLGRIVAKRQALPLYDVDNQIEETAGKTISAIFADDGEEFFRAMETKILNTILDSPPGIVASGGGSILRRANRERIARGNWVIYLQASAAVIAQRLSAKNNRPLLTAKSDAEKRKKITSVLKARAPLYRAAAHQILAINPTMTEQENAERLLTVIAALTSKPR